LKNQTQKKSLFALVKSLILILKCRKYEKKSNIFRFRMRDACDTTTIHFPRCTNTLAHLQTADDVDDIQAICDLGNENAFYYFSYSPFFSLVYLWHHHTTAAESVRSSRFSCVTCINITPNKFSDAVREIKNNTRKKFAVLYK
jgi:hypothetical protein